MAYADKRLTCVDCNSPFTFSAEEQEAFAAKGYIHPPKRCPACRETHRRSQSAGAYGESGGFRAARTMYPAVCAACGAKTEVPFQPRTDRPVYCPDCYRKQKPSGTYPTGPRRRY